MAELTGADVDAPALVDDRGELTWAELEDQTNRLAAGFRAGGLADGDHVSIVMSNRVEYFVGLIAAMRAGLVVTPVKSSWTLDEVTYLLGDAGTKAVLSDTAVGHQAALDLGLFSIDLEAGVSEPESGHPPVPFVDWMASQDATPQPGDRAGFRLSYTSGTTGRPKAVQLASAGKSPFTTSFPASAGFASMLHMPLDGPHLNCSALYHGAPLAFSLAALAGGATVRIIDRFDAQRVQDLICAEGIRSTCMVPTMFRKLSHLEMPGEHHLGALIHGGEPCPRPLKSETVDRFGPVLVEYYGFTEGGFCVADTAEWQERPGTVGRALMGLEIHVRDEAGEPLPPGTVGTVFFRDPAGPRFEYRGEPEKTASAFGANDAFTVGDIGWVDEDGYLFLCGRTTDVIISAGVNLYPAQIEEAIAGIDGVNECCVVGGPHPERGEVPVAFVAVADGHNFEEITAKAQQRCEERLARYERPDDWRQVEALPRDGTGKLLRRQVRDPLWQGQDSTFAN